MDAREMIANRSRQAALNQKQDLTAMLKGLVQVFRDDQELRESFAELVQELMTGKKPQKRNSRADYFREYRARKASVTSDTANAPNNAPTESNAISPGAPNAPNHEG